MKRLAILSAGVAAVIVFAATPPRIQTWAKWNDYAGTADSMQYSSLKQINKANVAQLKLAWQVKAPGPSGRFSFNPLVIDGKMYLVGDNNSIFALDATTGKQLWVHHVEGRPTNRGFNYWESADRSDQRLIFAAALLQLIHLGRGARILPASERGSRKGRVGWERGRHQGQQWQWDDGHLVATAPQMWDGPKPDGRRRCLFETKRAMRKCVILGQAGSAVFL